ncbi:MAG: hypothetical protein RL219_206 [Actinomycetota bacterium]|jgi:hypothetical protein
MARNELLWEPGGIPTLHRPIMVLALSGLFDVSRTATKAVEHLVTTRVVDTIAEIDCDGFYDFTQERPTVWLDEYGDRQITWPVNELQAIRYPNMPHDLVVLAGVEPHVRWRTFAELVIEVAQACNCEVVVTLGASPEAVPHTRVPHVFGSSTTAALAKSLGLSRPQYQGPTGVFGVLHQLLERADIPAISLRVPVPHYLMNAEHPKSTAALLRHLEHVLGVPTNHAALDDEVARWRELHDTAVADDRQAASFLAMLERDFDRRTEASIPSAEHLAEQFEQFLREQRSGE